MALAASAVLAELPDAQLEAAIEGLRRESERIEAETPVAR